MTRSEKVAAFLWPAVACAAWTVYAGKDVNWDLLNYHYYIPFELLAGRLEQDFFAASGQSYLNPLGYLPFYLMVSAGWHSVVVSVLLAVTESASIGLLFLIARRLFAHLPSGQRTTLSWLAAALGLSNAVYWETLGTSFLDPLLLPPMLTAVWLLLGEGTSAVRRSFLAGVLLGSAAALKYADAIFGVAAFLLTLTMPGVRGRARWHASAAYIGGGVAAVVILAGPWLALLFREFGNPVFPLMNGWFRSPDFLPFNLANDRFTLGSLAEAAAFPFRIIPLDRSVYAETFAPDLRLALLLAAAAALVVVSTMRREPGPARLQPVDWRLFAFFCAALALWLATSANARYGLLVLLLAGVCLARMVERLLPPPTARIGLAAVLVVQLGMTVVVAPPRWFIAEQWSRHWLPYEAAPQALAAPAMYLSIEVLPMAVVAPFVHPGSSFVNLRGQLSVPPDSARLTALLERHRGHVRALGRSLEPVDGKVLPNVLAQYDETLTRIGFRLDPSDCYRIAWRPDDSDWLSQAANRLGAPWRAHEPLSAVSCGLRAVARDPAQAKEERSMSLLFDRIEGACPRLFRGQTAVTEPLLGGWSRNYAGLDARLEASGDRVVLNRYRRRIQIELGLLSGWKRDDPVIPPACGGARRGPPL